MTRDAVNPALESIGLQTRLVEGKRTKWIPTEEGAKHSKIVIGTDKKGEYQMVVWDEAAVVAKLASFAPPTRDEFNSKIAELEEKVNKLIAER
jgi:hypothetical protein